jgi:hypothetical protein
LLLDLAGLANLVVRGTTPPREKPLGLGSSFPGKGVVQKKGVHMGRGGIIWTIVGVLLIIALIIYIF